MRRIITGLVVAVVISGALLAWMQQTSTETNQPYYTYVALGDSYTIGENVKATERWPNQLVERLRQEGTDLRLVANPSSTGFTTDDLLRTQLDELEKYRPDFITIQIGVNDHYQGRSYNEFRASYEKVLTEVRERAPQAKILALTVPNYGITPFGKRTTDTATVTREIKEYNDAIKQISNNNGIRVVDIYPISLLVAEDSTLVTYDGLHPAGAQYAQWVDLLTPATLVLLNEN